MAIYAPGRDKEFTPCPKGWTQFVCVDVIEKGLVPTPWGDKYKIQVRYQTNKRDEAGRRFMLFETFTQSMSPRSNLYGRITTWLGREMGAEEREHFDLDGLVGMNGMAMVIHNPDAKGTIWANIQSSTPLHDGMAEIESEDYDRVVERDDYEAPETTYTPPDEFYEKLGVEPPDGNADDLF